MAVSHFKDLQCWRLADGMRAEIIAICARPDVSRDFKFCDSFRSAGGSVCRNIAEGFARYESGEIVQFFRYALASLAEVEDHLKECGQRGLLDPAAGERLTDTCEHIKAMMLKFIKPHLARTAGGVRGRRST